MSLFHRPHFWRSPGNWRELAEREQYRRLLARFGAAAVSRHMSHGRLQRAVRARVRRGLI